jgi:hypothetical protein
VPSRRILPVKPRTSAVPACSRVPEPRSS